MRFLVPTLLIATTLFTRATTTPSQTEEQEWQTADGALRGRVESVTCSPAGKAGRLVTRAVIVVEETLRGKLPARLEVTWPGGSLGGKGEDHGDYPVLRPGDERLFFVSRKDGALTLTNGGVSAKKLARSVDGTLTLDEVLRQRRFQRMKDAEAAPADLTAYKAPAPAGGANVAAVDGEGGTVDKSGLSLDPLSQLPARWVAPDRGEPISYIVDATVLPPGVTLSQALTAVSNALAAWSSITGMTFRYEGLQDFANSADMVMLNDEKIRIQLHDTWGVTPGAAIGIGGRAWTSTDALLDTIGGGGGQVAGLEFHKAVRGYVVIRHTATQFSNLKTLEEVLCHELGHVFGLTHSSELPAEPNATLSDATMYYKVHGDNRGASIRAYDTPVMQKVHPLTNTPPWSYPRYMTAHTGTQAQTAPGVNEYTLKGYDRQTSSASLTLSTGKCAPPEAYAPEKPLETKFSFNGNKVMFDLRTNNPPTDGGVGDPATSYLYMVLHRFSDGVNCSPWQPVNIIALRKDSYPVGSGIYGDGMPDSWMQTNFSNPAPSINTLSRAEDDPDGDGLTNLEEYRLNTNPKRVTSRFDFNSMNNDTLKWLARPWALYELETSADGITWQFWKATVATAAPLATVVEGSIWAPRDPSQGRRFLRLKQAQ